MHSAKCILNQAQYSADTFSAISQGHQETLKENLVCPACNRPAFYRRGTEGGRGPCFCARPHADDCSLKSQMMGASSLNTNDQHEQTLQSGQTLVVDFNFGGHPASNGFEDCGVVRSADDSDSNPTKGGRVNHVRKLRLNSILRQLMISDEFAKTRMPVKLQGQLDPISANELFLPAHLATASNGCSFHAFWGQLTWANLDKGNSLWLNFGRPHQLSVLIPSQCVSEFMIRFDIELFEQLIGAYALAFGQLKTSSLGKPYVKLDNLALISIQR